MHNRVLFAPIIQGATAAATATTHGNNNGGGGVGEGLLQAASMVVRPQVVTFRRANEFGVWESTSGFGIVVVVRFR
ncbi:hypothetical protein QBC46DRAFT_159378 [Diplogelasinospora grovesii]|uniref:Secreted protein n=1 Tax=Diplogelasinospora grovesii TaxID=303347 RepID=A0AAN6S386_9PEZI|nr:hypothetical protein QBC46DRAFT_159378 [Diplogelasinospora grovesii]